MYEQPKAPPLCKCHIKVQNLDVLDAVHGQEPGYSHVSSMLPGCQVAVMSNPWVFLAVWLVSFVLMMVLAYNAEARRIYPYNYVTLVLFTLSFAFLVGIITSMFNVYLLLMAVAFTAATVGFILILATVSDFDFTRTGDVPLFVARTAALVPFCNRRESARCWHIMNTHLLK
jgi:membrane glycosyltransferase